MTDEIKSLQDFLSRNSDYELEEYRELIQANVQNFNLVTALFIISDLGTRIPLPSEYRKLAVVISQQLTERPRKATEAAVTSASIVKRRGLILPDQDLASFLINHYNTPSVINSIAVRIRHDLDLAASERYFMFSWFLFPRSTLVILNYVKVLEQLGKTSEVYSACWSFSKNADVSEDFVEYFVNFLVRHRKYKSCNKFVTTQNIIDKFKFSHGINVSLGDLQLCLGNFPAAIKNYEIASEIRKTPNLICQLGLAQWANGEILSAFQTLSLLFKMSESPAHKVLFIKFLHSSEDNSAFVHPLRNLDNNVRRYCAKNSKALVGRRIETSSFLNGLKDIVPRDLQSLEISDSEIFTGRLSNLNCELYKEIFSSNTVIAGRCFSCFKLEIVLRDLGALLRFTVFVKNEAQLASFISKALRDDRSFSEYKYKAIFYCDSLDDLDLIYHFFENRIHEFHILKKIKRRGCSEFTNTHPDFQIANDKVKKYATQPLQWKAYETEYSEIERPVENGYINQKSQFSDFTLFDALIALRWERLTKNYALRSD